MLIKSYRLDYIIACYYKFPRAMLICEGGEDPVTDEAIFRMKWLTNGSSSDIKKCLPAMENRDLRGRGLCQMLHLSYGSSHASRYLLESQHLRWIPVGK